MTMSTSVKHDVPHFAIFHSRNDTGICPVCLMSEAKTWQDLLTRAEQAVEIAKSQIRREREERQAEALLKEQKRKPKG